LRQPVEFQPVDQPGEFALVRRVARIADHGLRHQQHGLLEITGLAVQVTEVGVKNRVAGNQAASPFPCMDGLLDPAKARQAAAENVQRMDFVWVAGQDAFADPDGFFQLALVVARDRPVEFGRCAAVSLM